jgi:hypothetical protein
MDNKYTARKQTAFDQAIKASTLKEPLHSIFIRPLQLNAPCGAVREIN